MLISIDNTIMKADTIVMRVIIFDFNRTIYDPDTQQLIEDAELMLQHLTSQGFILFLISRAEQGREELIESLGLRRYFKRIHIVQDKVQQDFAALIDNKLIDRRTSFIIGDQVKKEIRIGNWLGLKTIWLRRGKFADELPEADGEHPTHTIESLNGLLSIVR